MFTPPCQLSASEKSTWSVFVVSISSEIFSTIEILSVSFEEISSAVSSSKDRSETNVFCKLQEH